jgi:polysaccharide biosynthesis protein VpsM
MAAAACAFTLPVHAQNLTTASASGGSLMLSEGIKLTPQVSLGLGHNDNVTGVSAGAISSTVWSLQPRLVAETERGGQRYSLLYAGNFTRYQSSSADNFNSHTLEAAGDHVLGVRSRMGWATNVVYNTDPRDSTSPTADDWRGLGARGVYRYGAEGAQGNLEAEYAYFNKRYDQASAADGDLDSHLVAGRFFWRVMPKTHVVVEARLTDTNYRLGNANDNLDTRLLAGLTWQATAKTTGSVKVGHQKRNFQGKADFSGLTYEGSVQWSPVAHSTVTLSANRSAQDSTDAGVSFQKTNGVSLGWSHQWSSRVSTQANLSDNGRTDVGTGRQDNTLGVGFGVNYQIGRQYVLGFNLNHTDNKSSLSGSAYKRNTVLVQLQAQL